MVTDHLTPNDEFQQGNARQAQASRDALPLLSAAAEQAIIDYLGAAIRREAGVPLQRLCLNILPRNRQLLLRSIESLARRGVVQLRARSGDIVVRLAEEVRR
jgi:hypothetical protein